MKLIHNKINWKKMIRKFRNPLIFIILFTTAYVLNTYIARLALVSGESMYPTLMDGDILLVNQVNHEPSRGDVILIDVSASPLVGRYIVKRVIAIEGDTVSLDYENNAVLVNGERISEPYLNRSQDDPMKAIDSTNNISYQVPFGTVFVMGDNRNNSVDSRSDMLGMIKKSDVVGKVCLHFSLSQYFR